MADAPDARDEETTDTEALAVDAAADDSERRRRALAGLAIVAIIVLVILLLLARPAADVTNVESANVLSAAPSLAGSRTAPPAVVATTVIVPDVVGLDEQPGRVKLENSDLGSTTEWISAGEPEGTIIQQFPNAGVEVAHGTVVELTISAGLGGLGSVGGPVVPDVLGMSASDAKAKLRAKGWSYSLIYAPSTTTPSGLVFYQDPGAGTDAGSLRRVRIWVSGGTPTNGFPYPRPEN